MEADPHPKFPVISILIPCYNQAEYLVEAIESALDQTYAPLEVIVIDDGSTDETAQVAAGYGNRVRYVYKPNGGLSAARNTGLLLAQGEFVHFLDSDDFLPPDMLQRQMAAALRNPTAGVLHGGWQEVDGASCPGLRYVARAMPPDAFHALLAENLGPPCCVTARRSAFANAGLFDVSLTSCEDWDMWIRLAAAGVAFVAVPEACAFYRKHPQSMSTHFERMWRMACAVLDRAQTCHPACAMCRKILPMTRHRLRDGYFASLMFKKVLTLYRQGRFGTGTLHLFHAMLRNPALPRFLVAKSVSRLRRRIGGPPPGARSAQTP